MDCPACGHGLSEIVVNEVKVDVCQGGCGGLWFDQLEIIKFDEQHEHAGPELLEVERDPGVTVDHEERRTCPRCTGQVMMRHYFSPGTGVEVDECPACAGYWLDSGELSGIRKAFPTEDERRAAASQYFDQKFAADMVKARAETEQQTRFARRFANLFAFLCPTAYIPGKQKWGAH